MAEDDVSWDDLVPYDPSGGGGGGERVPDWSELRPLEGVTNIHTEHMGLGDTEFHTTWQQPDRTADPDRPYGSATQGERSSLGVAIREGARGVLPGQAAIEGAIAGAELGAAGGPIGSFAGALVGGVGAGYLASKAQSAATDALGLDSPESRAADVQAHPYVATAAQFASAPASLTGKGASLMQRLATGGLMGGFDLLNQGIQGEPLDLGKAAIAGAAGAAFPNPRPWANEVAGSGLRKLGSSIGNDYIRTSGERLGARAAAERAPTVENTQNTGSEASNAAQADRTATNEVPPAGTVDQAATMPQADAGLDEAVANLRPNDGVTRIDPERPITPEQQAVFDNKQPGVNSASIEGPRPQGRDATQLANNPDYAQQVFPTRDISLPRNQRAPARPPEPTPPPPVGEDPNQLRLFETRRYNQGTQPPTEALSDVGSTPTPAAPPSPAPPPPQGAPLELPGSASEQTRAARAQGRQDALNGAPPPNYREPLNNRAYQEGLEEARQQPTAVKSDNAPLPDNVPDWAQLRPVRPEEAVQVPAREQNLQANGMPQPEKPVGIETSQNPTTTKIGTPLRAKGYQNWDVGSKVNVGFAKNLEVLGKDGNAYVLRSPTGKLYDFVPHEGLAEREGGFSTPAAETAPESGKFPAQPRSLSAGAAPEATYGPSPQQPTAARAAANAGRWKAVNDKFDKLFGLAKWVFAPHTISPLSEQQDKIITKHMGFTRNDLAQRQSALADVDAYFHTMTPQERTSVVTDYEGGAIDNAHPGNHFMKQARSVADQLKNELTSSGAWDQYNRSTTPSFFKEGERTQIKNDMQDFHDKNKRWPTLGEVLKWGYHLEDDLVRADGSPEPERVVAQQNYLKSMAIERARIIRDDIHGVRADPSTGARALEPLLHSGPGEGLVAVPKELTNDVQYYAAPEVGRVLDAYFNPLIRDPSIRNSYDAYMRLKTASNQWALLGGIYHMRFMFQEAWINEMMAGMQRLYKNPQEGVKDMAKAIFAPYSLFKEGKNMVLDGILHPETVKDALQKKILGYLKEGGMLPPMRFRGMEVTPELETGALKGIATAWKPALRQYKQDLIQRGLKTKAKYEAKQYGGAAKDAALGSLQAFSEGMQLLMHPIFNHYIPLLKAGATYRNMSRFVADNPGLSHDDYVEAARRFVRATDNAMGELNQGTLYAPGWVKATGNATMVSMGWNIGDVKQFLGGLRAFARNPQAAFTGKDLDPRIMYIPAFVAVTAMQNIAAQLLHGQGLPGSTDNKGESHFFRDIAFPRSGGKTKAGNPERIIQPGYEKDVAEAANIVGGPDPLGKGLTHMMYNKLAPMPRTALDEFVFNQNFAGKQIANPNDPFATQMKDYMAYALKQMALPIMVQTMNNDNNPRTNIGPIERLLGDRHAPREWQDPKEVAEQARKQHQKEADEAKRFHKKTGL